MLPISFVEILTPLKADQKTKITAQAEKNQTAMQQKMQELQTVLERLEIVGTSGAGLVKVTVNGKNETRKVEIDASLFVPADKGVVEDLIVAAANDARTKVEQTVQEQMRGITGGMTLPPGFKL